MAHVVPHTEVQQGVDTAVKVSQALSQSQAYLNGLGLSVGHLDQLQKVVGRPAQEEGADQAGQDPQVTGLTVETCALDPHACQQVAAQDDQEGEEETTHEADGVEGRLGSDPALYLLFLQKESGQW